MSKWLMTDFIRSRMVLLGFILGMMMDLLYLRTILHALVLMFLPYVISVGLNYLMNQSEVSYQARVSAQFRRNGSRGPKIRIDPRK